jgi:hypothetical protein
VGEALPSVALMESVSAEPGCRLAELPELQWVGMAYQWATPLVLA